jgi:hypothetical protein
MCQKVMLNKAAETAIWRFVGIDPFNLYVKLEWGSQAWDIASSAEKDLIISEFVEVCLASFAIAGLQNTLHVAQDNAACLDMDLVNEAPTF